MQTSRQGSLSSKKKTMKNLWNKMEHCHFSITQLSMNMGKLTSTNHICSSICENSLPSLLHFHSAILAPLGIFRSEYDYEYEYEF